MRFNKAFLMLVLFFSPTAALAEDPKLSCDGPDCANVAAYRYQDGYCYGFNASGKRLGWTPITNLCAGDKITKYELRNERCVALTASGQVAERYSNPSKCRTVAYHAYVKNDCYAFNSTGTRIAIDFDDSKCAADDPVVRYEIRGDGCRGLTRGGQVGDTYVDPVKCGKPAYYSIEDRYCYAFDAQGKRLGWSSDSSRCNADKIVRYEIQGESCTGLTARGALAEKYTNPRNCGTVAKYAWRDTYCHAFDAQGKLLGITFNSEHCANDRIVRYEIVGDGCSGFTASGNMADRYVDPNLCAANAMYDFKLAMCSNCVRAPATRQSGTTEKLYSSPEDNMSVDPSTATPATAALP